MTVTTKETIETMLQTLSGQEQIEWVKGLSNESLAIASSLMRGVNVDDWGTASLPFVQTALLEEWASRAFSGRIVFIKGGGSDA